MKYFLAYIRVSTVRQGEGVSLQEQRDAIIRYAQRNGIEIKTWFEERETAAKRGRPVFNQMMRLLRQGKADGLVVHKIDRSARNLKDWADLGELLDANVEVRFVTESLDLTSRGGRLAADVQAVVAADYIRNLREETRKGFYGRLKQGVYPLPAPIGYLDPGAGKPKEINPTAGPLVRHAFELYSTGRYNLMTLREELQRLGLRNRKGTALSLNGVSTMLNNPFYIGLMHLRSTNETFPGGHEALVTKVLFDRVRAVLEGKTNRRTRKHDFTCRRLFQCGTCGRSLIGSERKGHVYFRCQTRECPTTSVRENALEDAIRSAYRPLTMGEEERSCMLAIVAEIRQEWTAQRKSEEETLRLGLGQIGSRLARLTDTFIDGNLEKPLFEERKTALLLERRQLQDSLSDLERNPGRTLDRVEEFLGLAGDAYFLYESAIPQEKRRLTKILTSDRVVTEKNIEITLRPAFQIIAERAKLRQGGPYREIPRTSALRCIVAKLITCVKDSADTVLESGDGSERVAA